MEIRMIGPRPSIILIEEQT